MIVLPAHGVLKLKASELISDKRLLRDISITPKQGPKMCIEEIRAGKTLILKGTLLLEYLARPNPKLQERKLYLTAIVSSGDLVRVVIRSLASSNQLIDASIRVGTLTGEVGSTIIPLIEV